MKREYIQMNTINHPNQSTISIIGINYSKLDMMELLILGTRAELNENRDYLTTENIRYYENLLDNLYKEKEKLKDELKELMK